MTETTHLRELTASLLTRKPSPLPTLQGFSLLGGPPSLPHSWQLQQPVGLGRIPGNGGCCSDVNTRMLLSTDNALKNTTESWSSCSRVEGRPLSPAQQSMRRLRPRALRDGSGPWHPCLGSHPHPHHQSPAHRATPTPESPQSGGGKPHRGQQTTARRPDTTCNLLFVQPLSPE